MAAGSRADSEAAAHHEAAASSASQPTRILFIDAYDSFTNNIVSLLRTILGADVFVVRIDLSTHDDGQWTETEFVDNLSQFDAVVCGPGPGSPLNPHDVGAFRLLWQLPSQLQLPVLGICLGFQSLVAAHGGDIRRLQRGLHGMVRHIDHRDHVPGDIFYRVPEFKATLYHSLCADIGQDDDPDLSYHEWHSVTRWAPTVRAPQLQPLAWATETRGDGRGERILMGVRHVTKPFWGLQYHPESVCTEPAAHAVLENWFREALRWNQLHGRQVQSGSLLRIQTLSPPNHLEAVAAHKLKARQRGAETTWWTRGGLRDVGRDCEYTHRTIPLPYGVGVLEIVEALGLGNGESIILDASSHKNGDPLALHSIVALDVEAALRIEFHVSDHFATIRIPGIDGNTDRTETINLDGEATSIWEIISDFWQARSHPPGSMETNSAFKGGFMGFITYEMGIHGLDAKMVSEERGHNRPDAHLAWVSKSIVLDHRLELPISNTCGHGAQVISGLTT